MFNKKALILLRAFLCSIAEAVVFYMCLTSSNEGPTDCMTTSSCDLLMPSVRLQRNKSHGSAVSIRVFDARISGRISSLILVKNRTVSYRNEIKTIPCRIKFWPPFNGTLILLSSRDSCVSTGLYFLRVALHHRELGEHARNKLRFLNDLSMATKTACPLNGIVIFVGYVFSYGASR